MDPCFIIDLSVLDPLDPHLPVDILKDYTLEFEVRGKGTLTDLRECLTEAIQDRDCYKKAFDAIVEDFDEMGRTNEAKLTILHVELAQRGQTLLVTEVECTQLGSRVTSLESELSDLTQSFTILGQTRDEEKVTMRLAVPRQVVGLMI